VARLVLAFAAAAVATAALIPAVLSALRHRQILDSPNDRSSHSVPTPRGAGFAQVVGVTTALAVTWCIPFAGPVAAVGFSVIGMADDLRPRRASLRLALQLAVAILAVALLIGGGDRGPTLTATLGVISVVWLLYVVNATNFMDGINGISIAHGVLFGAAYAAILWHSGRADWSVLAVAVAGASLAVSPWNWGRSARIFLGDSGSYLLGGSVGILALAAWFDGTSVLIVIGPVAIYVADTLATLASRALRRESLTTAHRDHVYQQLVRGGWSHPRTAGTVVAFSTVCAVIAVLQQQGLFAAWAAGTLLCVVVACYLVLPRTVSVA
jgi:UDP-N-acetylmuramyl pentapeptide phosphotransferase/UDP-N-acetylglucosamine-1-phosphate transferase